MPYWQNILRRLVRGEEGQDLIEYTFLILFIALVLAATLQATQSPIAAVFLRIVAVVNSAS